MNVLRKSEVSDIRNDVVSPVDLDVFCDRVKNLIKLGDYGHVLCSLLQCLRGDGDFSPRRRRTELETMEKAQKLR